jgi:aryl-alcohol dehydrogenase-like predicted oxidoreductase
MNQSLETHSFVETVELAPGYKIPRVIRGGWQLAGDHGEVDKARAIADMETFVTAGLNTVDGADIYTGVEEMYGEFNARQRAAGRALLQVHTKFVPDYGDLEHVDESYVRRIIKRSLQRLKVERLDLVQFHWWNYAMGDFVAVAQTLNMLRKEGLIANLGGTNFDTRSSQLMVNSGIPLVSMQVQYSILDRRPAHSLALKTIADRHGVSVSTIATRWVLDQPSVAAAIVGARYSNRVGNTLDVFKVQLGAEDHALLNPILVRHPGPSGDTYTLERDKNGPHGRIMKYELNKS